MLLLEQVTPRRDKRALWPWQNVTTNDKKFMYVHISVDTKFPSNKQFSCLRENQ